MKNHQDTTWIGITDKNNDPELQDVAQSEFVGLPIAEALSSEKIVENASANRRDFLKYLGFGLGAATVASCETPVRHAIPYVVKPDTIVPGVASYYASAIVNGGDFCPVLIKTREGRPIKIEGNPMSSITKGGTTARAQASVLSLYDSDRLKSAGTIENGTFTKGNWADIDKAVAGKLTASSNIRVVCNTVMSPTTKKVFNEFKGAFPNTKVVTYDPISSSAMLQANQENFGEAVIPNYHFDKAQVIVSFGADFLGSWISPIEYSHQYIKNRNVSKGKGAKMSRHIQVESGMSMTGSNADNRIMIKPSEQGAAIATLLENLGGGGSPYKVNAKAAKALKNLASELQANVGKCLVVSNSNNKAEQILVNKINDLLGSYGATMDFGAVSYQRQGIDAEIQGLVKEMQNGGVDAVLFWNANPVYDLPNGDAFAAALSKVSTKVSMALSMDETTSLCDYAMPTHHNLEAWGDVEPKRGQYALIQPTIAPLYSTRQGESSLLMLANSPNINNTSERPYYEYLKQNWGAMATTAGFSSGRQFWDEALSNGVYATKASATVAGGGVQVGGGSINKPSSAEFELSFYETVNMGNGNYANNPWLIEMPDPVMRTVWGNYLAVPINWNESDGRFEGFKGVGRKVVKGIADKLKVTHNSVEQTYSTVPQFGQMNGTASIGLGYGRSVVGKAGKDVGQNVYPWCTIDADGNTQYFATGATVSEMVGQDDEFGCVQYHHTYGVSGQYDGETVNVDEVDIVPIGKGYQGAITDRTVLFKDSLSNMDGLLEDMTKKRNNAKHLNDATLYPFEEYSAELYSQGHHWGMHIDLNSCTGCSACTVACMAENNVPVVGNREVSRHHEMTWLRIDRYYYGEAENPNVVFQPVMCQHCDNAPCENVCPVNATNHSSEGLNQMAYNRCVGTRYCANNCPYKVRRFNWLDYTSADLFGGNQNAINSEDPAYYTDNIVRMVLNPDVTVRSRGVIEKCSFCAQRLQQGKLTAKAEGRRLRDNDVKTACQTACPTGAITFGDRNNKEGSLVQKIKSPLVYRMLDEVNTQSSVFYQARVNNKDEKLDA